VVLVCVVNLPHDPICPLHSCRAVGEPGAVVEQVLNSLEMRATTTPAMIRQHSLAPFVHAEQEDRIYVFAFCSCRREVILGSGPGQSVSGGGKQPAKWATLWAESEHELVKCPLDYFSNLVRLGPRLS